MFKAVLYILVHLIVTQILILSFCFFGLWLNFPADQRIIQLLSWFISFIFSTNKIWLKNVLTFDPKWLEARVMANTFCWNVMRMYHTVFPKQASHIWSGNIRIPQPRSLYNVTMHSKEIQTKGDHPLPLPLHVLKFSVHTAAPLRAYRPLRPHGLPSNIFLKSHPS